MKVLQNDFIIDTKSTFQKLLANPFFCRFANIYVNQLFYDIMYIHDMINFSLIKFIDKFMRIILTDF